MLTIHDIKADLKISTRQVYRIIARDDFPRAKIVGCLRRWEPKTYNEWKRRLPSER
jgi:predicted DNA-binding transcriptional regulator AlpA